MIFLKQLHGVQNGTSFVFCTWWVSWRPSPPIDELHVIRRASSMTLQGSSSRWTATMAVWTEFNVGVGANTPLPSTCLLHDTSSQHEPVHHYGERRAVWINIHLAPTLHFPARASSMILPVSSSRCTITLRDEPRPAAEAPPSFLTARPR